MGQIFALGGGLEQIVRKIRRRLRRHIQLNTEVQCITKMPDGSFEARASNQILRARRLFLCTDLRGALRIKYHYIPAIGPLLDCLTPHCTLRFYAWFKQPVDWWLGTYRQMVSDRTFTWLIRLSDHLVMLSYVDDEEARSLSALGPGALDRVLEEISSCLGLTSTAVAKVKGEVEKVWLDFWEESYCTIRPDLTRKDIDAELKALPPGFVQTVAPKDGGRDQSWMESHLVRVSVER